MIIKKICAELFKIAEAIHGELGGGFNEAINQNALAIELREAKIDYLKEVNIEIFYKEQSIGTDRPDFIILPPGKKRWEMKKPIVLETKVAPKFTDDHRQQLKSYLKSFPHNKHTNLKGIAEGILLKFHKSDSYKDLNAPIANTPIEIEYWRYSKRTNKIMLKFKLPFVKKSEKK